jgi:hypothetical protein
MATKPKKKNKAMSLGEFHKTTGEPTTETNASSFKSKNWAEEMDKLDVDGK